MSSKMLSSLRVKGMKDIYFKYPYYKLIIDHFTSVFDRTGYNCIVSNILENSDLFSRTLGVTSDIVGKEMYEFEDKGKNNLVLRPEGTAGVMRYLVSEKEIMKTIEKIPARLWYWGPMFRYEQPQTGRSRQFYQIGIEKIGGAGSIQSKRDKGYMVQSDFEIIQMGYEALKRVAGECKQSEIKPKVYINTLGDRNTLEIYNQKLIQFYKEKVDKLSKESQRRFQEKKALRILDSKDPEDKLINQSAPIIDDFIEEPYKSSFTELLSLLKDFDIQFERDQSLVRGLDYYNGTCFEIKLESAMVNLDAILGPSQNTVLAGGRYDYLATHFLDDYYKNGIPAIGFAAGIDRLALILEKFTTCQLQSKHIQPIGITYVLNKDEMHMAEKVRQRCIDIGMKIKQLRPELRVEWNMSESRKLSDKLDILMNQMDCKNVLVIGSTELEQNVIIVKQDQLKEKKQIRMDDLPNYLKSI